MNRTELISAIAEQTGDTKKKTGEVLDTILNTIIDALSDGDEVAISGFGKFSVTERAAREGRNPLTGEAISIEAKKAPKFKPSSNLKAAIN